jgi:hypothetical protein
MGSSHAYLRNEQQQHHIGGLLKQQPSVAAALLGPGFSSFFPGSIPATEQPMVTHTCSILQGAEL